MDKHIVRVGTVDNQMPVLQTYQNITGKIIMGVSLWCNG